MNIDAQLQLLRTWRDEAEAASSSLARPAGLRSKVSAQAAQTLDNTLRQRRGPRLETPGGRLFAGNEIAPI